LSHLKERKKQNCLNCNAQVQGKYCHICGQENVEPAESLWHLVTHFFNDITHFDGKFFSTGGLLITRPGFLSAEYKMGRRSNYLNPVRMYVFTSFVFFFVFFSTVHIDEDLFKSSVGGSLVDAIIKTDSTEFSNSLSEINSMNETEFKVFTRAVNKGRTMPRDHFKIYSDSIRKIRKTYYVASPMVIIQLMDSTAFKSVDDAVNDMDSSTFSKFIKLINGGKEMSRSDFYSRRDSARKSTKILFGKRYQGRAEYDSLVKKAVVKDGWMKQKISQKLFDIDEKISNSKDGVISNLFNILLHNFPQLLFISLPLFALFLKLIYYRHKNFYLVSHGIFTVHLYIFYFIALLAMIFLNEIGDYMHWSWPGNIISVLIFLLFVYEYKAMRNFYGQGRLKTIIKFCLAGAGRFFIITFLFLIFLLFSFLKI